MENNSNDEVVIDLSVLFKNLLEHWKFIASVFAIMTALAIIITAVFIPKQYESSISMYVNNGSKSNENYINSSDIAASRNLVSTYMELIKSKSLLNEVLKRIDYKSLEIEKDSLSVNTLKKMIVCQQIKDTEIFEVRVKSTSPELSTEIAKRISQIAPSEIRRVFKAGYVEIIDKAELPKNHVSPSIKKNAVLGGLLGIVLSCGIIVVFTLLNQKVISPKDYESKYDIPLLGIIPDNDVKSNI